MEKETIKWFLDKILEYPSNTWVGFKRIAPIIFIGTIIFDYKILMPLLENYFNASEFFLKIVFITTLSFFFFYIIYFFIQRLIIWIQVSLSKKINIVIAYNLESVLPLNEEKFKNKYLVFIKTLNNLIIENDLNKNIKLIVAPTDIQLNGSSAEAKTKLGLYGATLLVWGYLIKSKDSYDFKTKFSYEFGHNKNISKEQAINIVNKYIESFTQGSLLVKSRYSSFEENLFLTCLFILGFASFTFRNFSKSKIIFELFRNKLKSSSLMTQKDFSNLNEEVKKFLYQIYFFEIKQYIDLDSFIKNKHIIGESVNKIITFFPRDYDANLILSVLYDLEDNKSLALRYNNIAEENAPKNNFAHVFNKAYFSLSEGNFEDTLKYYNSIPANGEDINTLTSSISRYLNRKFILTNKLEFLFADGLVAYKWDDKSIGRKILKEFLNKAQDSSYLLLLKQEAEKILDNKELD